MGRPLLPLISVEALTTAALELVDESGDFSFPKLAKRIGVSQSSIYNHVSGRDEILELLRHRIITEEPYRPVDHSDWEAALRVLIRAYRDAFARHPRLAPDQLGAFAQSVSAVDAEPMVTGGQRAYLSEMIPVQPGDQVDFLIPYTR